MQKVSIVIPVYNEERLLPLVIDKVVQAATPSFTKEIILVDDGSKDGSADIIQQLANDKKYKGTEIRYILKKRNGGKGSALKVGFAEAKGDVLLVQDADLEYDPDEYGHLLKPFLKKDTKVVYGSRITGIKKYGNKYSSLVFYMGGRVLTFLMNLSFQSGITDQPTGYKLFHKDLKPLLLEEMKENDFSYEIEMTAILSKKGYHIYEVPISYTPRHVAEGKKIGWKDFVKSLQVLLRCRFSS